jgi:hypothetical protein
MRSHEGRLGWTARRRARRATRPFLPGWGETALEDRLLLTVQAEVTPAVAIAISPTTLPDDTVNVAYSKTLTASGGTAPYTFTVSSGTLPTGLSLNGATGAISGTPTVTGAYNFTVTATDSTSATGNQAYSVTINPPVSITTTSLAAGTVGANYSQTVSATGGTGTITFSETGTLPAGLSFSSTTGTLSGKPTASGTSTFSVTATDSVGGTNSKTYTVTISPAITFTTTTLPNTSVGVPYSQQIVATGGTGTLTYAVTTGTLPAGLTLSSTGLLSGTPTAAGVSAFTVTATDTVGGSTSNAYAVTVNPKLAFTTTALPQGAAGTPYSQQISATGGTGALTYAVAGGALPGGLSLSTAGLLSGTPTTSGVSNFSVRVTDGAGVTATQAFAVTILPVGSATGPTVTGVERTGVHRQTTTYVIAFNSALDPASAQDVANYSIVPIRHTRLDGAVVPLKSAVYNASNNTVTLTAFGNVRLNREYVLTINGTSPGGLKDASGNFLAGAGGAAGTNYVKYFGPEILAGHKAAAAAAAKLTTSLTDAINNSLLTIGDVQSIVSGVGAPGILDGPDVPLAVRLKRLAHSNSPTVGAVLDTVLQDLQNPPVSVLSLSPLTVPADTVGVPYSQTVVATGGAGGYQYGVTSGALPAGLTLNSTTGVISGTPTVAGTSNFTVSAIDSAGATGSQPYSLVINAAIAVSPASLPVAAVGSAYSEQITSTGGTGTVTFALTSGTLPAGLSFSSSGLVSGTPTATGSSTVTVTATDTVGAKTNQVYTVTVNQAVTLSPTSLPADTANTSYSQTIVASGGAGGYKYAVTAGALPAGLTLNTLTGALTGTPTAAGTSNFTVTATDTTGNTGSQAYTLVVNPAITITTASLPDGVVNTPYGQQINATGGTGGLTYTLSSGTLPAGLTLSATGAITGTPTAAGSSTFTVKATDTLNASTTKQFTLNIEQTVAVTPATLPNDTVNNPYNQTVVATGGTGGYTYAVSSGTLPDGLSLNTTSGAITGTPTTTGASTFTITATDSSSHTGNQTYTVTINPAVAITTTSLPDGTTGTPYNEVVAATGGTGPLAFTVTSGSLPDGLSLSAAGAITGTPTTAGTSNFTVTATDTVGASASQPLSITIA